MVDCVASSRVFLCSLADNVAQNMFEATVARTAVLPLWLLRLLLVLQRDNLFTSLPLQNSAGTEIRTRLRLRSTCRGANNRLDVDKIMSYDRGSDSAIPMLGACFDGHAAEHYDASAFACKGGPGVLLAIRRNIRQVVIFADHANGDEEDEEGVRHYKRGLAPYTFVAWDHLHDSILNLPIHKMDFYVAG